MCFEGRKKGFNNFFRHAVYREFINYDEQQLNPDLHGDAFDPDILNPNVEGVAPIMAWLGVNGFKRLCFDLLKQHRLFINAGILQMEGEEDFRDKAIMTRPTFIKNLQTMAREYRENNPKPTVMEIAAAAAVRAARDDVLSQLEEDKLSLSNELQDAKGELSTNEERLSDSMEKIKKDEGLMEKMTIRISELEGQVREPGVRDKVELLALTNLVNANESRVALDYYTKKDDKHRHHELTGKKIDILDQKCGTIIGAIAATPGGDPNRTKTQALASSFGELHGALNGAEAVALTEYVQLKADTVKLMAREAGLTEQFKDAEKKLEDATKKHEAELQRLLEEKDLRIDELTNQLMTSQQDNEKGVYDNNALTERNAELKSECKTLMMESIDGEAERAQMVAEKGYAKHDLKTANSRADGSERQLEAEKESRRKSTERNLEIKSQLQEKLTTTEQELVDQKEDRRKSSEGHNETEFQLQEQVTTLARELAKMKAPRETETAQHQAQAEE